MLSASLSIGIAECDPRMSDVLAWVHAADSALYDAKRLGRNRISLAQPLQREDAAVALAAG